jgi:hypothetical protein
MVVFRCVRCETVLTIAVDQVALPDHGTTPPMHGVGVCPPRMGQGLYAIDPAPFGPPYEPLAEAESILLHGYPGCHRAAGPRGTYVLAPGDVQNTRFIIDNCETGCWGLNEGAGPNLGCLSCGAEVGTRIDDCMCWQEVRLAPAAVYADEVDAHAATAAPFWWDIAEVDRLGTTPLDEHGVPDWRWFGALTSCAARILARSGGGLIFLAEGPASPIRDFLTALLHGTGHAHAIRRLPRTDTRNVEQWRVAADAVGLAPSQLTSERPAAICDLVGPGTPFTNASGLLADWCSQEQLEVSRLRLIGVVPRSETEFTDWPWPRLAQGAHEGSLKVQGVSLDAHVWSYLAHDQTQNIRSLVRTRWGHNGLAATVYRDEPPHRSPGAEIISYGGWGRRDLVKCLVEQPEAREPWLRTLIEELRPCRGR